MGWFDEQIRQRKEADRAAFEDSFREIAGAMRGETVPPPTPRERTMNGINTALGRPGSILAPALVTMAGTFLACLHGRRQLDGMNGDIAGYSICVGELCGMIALALMMFWS